MTIPSVPMILATYIFVIPAEAGIHKAEDVS
jgi:hypothetical protein